MNKVFCLLVLISTTFTFAQDSCDGLLGDALLSCVNNQQASQVQELTQNVEQLQHDKQQLEQELENYRNPLNQGLIAHYSFDDCNPNESYRVARDSSAFGFHGAVYGTPECVEGIQGNALHFITPSASGGNPGDSIELVPESVAGLSAFSLVLWIKTVQTENNDSFLLSSWDDAFTNDFGIYIRSGRGVSIISDHKGDVVPSCFVEQPVDDGQWHMLTFSFSSSKGIAYVDGQMIAELNDCPLGILAPESAKAGLKGGLWLAEEQDSQGGTWQSFQHYNGVMDEVRFYNRQLSHAEVQALYTKGDR